MCAGLFRDTENIQGYCNGPERGDKFLYMEAAPEQGFGRHLGGRFTMEFHWDEDKENGRM